MVNPGRSTRGGRLLRASVATGACRLRINVTLLSTFEVKLRDVAISLEALQIAASRYFDNALNDACRIGEL